MTVELYDATLRDGMQGEGMSLTAEEKVRVVHRLDDHGHVCEGSGENVFVVRDGTIFTPPQTAGILDGINRRSAIQIARDLGFELQERQVARDELYLADEIFMTGTAAEVTPVRSVDDHDVGVGPVTLELQKAYLDTVRGRSERWGHWLDRVQIENTASAEA